MSEQDKIKSYQAGRLSGKGEHAIAKLADEQKDPVREDLRAALDVWLQNHPGRSLAAGYLADGYLAGHGDGWNRCLDSVRDIALIKRTSFNDDTAMELFIKELEKMRR